jgi:hypothetical protein
MTLYKSLTFYYLAVSFKFIKFCFQVFLLFFPEMSISFTSYIALVLPASFDLKIVKTSIKSGLRLFNSFRPRVSLAAVLIFSLMFPQALFMFSLSFTVSSRKLQSSLES